MKKLISLLLILALALSLAGCSTDTFSINSTSKKFKLKNVSSITLAGPSDDSADGIQIQLDATTGGTDYTRLVELIQGKKLDECPTSEFGFCYASFSITTGETTKIYPANDGSNYIALFSFNPSMGKFLELDEEDMKEVVEIFEKYEIQVVY